MLRNEETSRPRSLDDLIDARLVARVSRLDYASRKIFAGKLKGERRSKKRGQSVEFADHRAYVPGDDIRFIDWNIYGRLDRLFLKLFLEEEDLSLHVVLDCSESMACGTPSKFRFAQRAAAALGYIGLVNYNRVSLTGVGIPPADEDADPGTTAPGGIVSSLRNLRGRRRASEMGEWLCSLEPCGTTEFRESAKRIAMGRQGKGVMIVLSDFFLKEGYEDALRMLVGRGYDLVAIQVLAPQEVEPEIGGDLRLRDIEDADVAEVTISAPLVKRYKENLAAYCAQLREFCARREITLLTVRSDLPIDMLLLDELRTRGIVR